MHSPALLLFRTQTSKHSIYGVFWVCLFVCFCAPICAVSSLAMRLYRYNTMRCLLSHSHIAITPPPQNAHPLRGDSTLQTPPQPTTTTTIPHANQTRPNRENDFHFVWMLYLWLRMRTNERERERERERDNIQK